LISGIGKKNEVVTFSGPLVRAQVAFRKHLSLGNSLSGEMQFRFDQVEEPRPVQRAAGFRIVACTWLGDVQKRGRWEPSPSHVLLAGSGLAAWLSRVVLG